jgi:hypothetical protein
MKTETIDFPATRGKLEEQRDAATAKLITLREGIGELALGVELGSGSRSELEASRAQEAVLVARITELTAALETLDEREAEHAAAEAQRRKEAAAVRYAELDAERAKLGAEVVARATALAGSLTQLCEAASEAAKIARFDLEVSTGQADRWVSLAFQVTQAILHETDRQFANVYHTAREFEEAKAELVGQQ